ncbi:MAG: hypothetical protein D9V44_10655 [Actinobacteria bacterium]|nr:MAG: hypothetical protein D9V44_10655 [Actinomycetota bacterium]
MAEACANRTHPGRSSRPTTVLKTAEPTRTHSPPGRYCGEPSGACQTSAPTLLVRGLSCGVHRTLILHSDTSGDKTRPVRTEPEHMRRLFAALRRKPAITAVIVVLALGALTGGAVAATNYTSRPGFCTSCHEMEPYYVAWNEGAHAGISCVSCHVEPGLKSEVAHKVVALKEVYNHFTTDPKFPGAVTDIPDSRCLACHSGTIDPGIPGFTHEAHRGERSCVDCHASAGHRVTSAALAEAGILDSQAKDRLAIAVVGAGAANLPGHIAVTCSNCHDLAKTSCVTCHTPEARSHPALKSVSATATGETSTCTTCHTTADSWSFEHATDVTTCVNCHTTPAEHRAGACTTCHEPGASWAFEHPSSTATCTTCHTRPAAHATETCTTCHTTGAAWTFKHPTSTSCASCHTAPARHYSGTCSACHSTKVAFKNTKFSHPGAAANCATCHKAPAKHYSGACKTCHNPKVAFSKATFTHPGAAANCATCHKAPAKHYSGACSSCHNPKTAFSAAKFTHPGSTATCTNCHSRPSGHSGLSCVTCHKPGGSWRFYHPTSTACSSCHRAPANHYGTTCANCHSPSRAWSSATFTHPSIPGGEHTYRSFACTKCHPSGYSSASCTACHRSGAPIDD